MCDDRHSLSGFVIFLAGAAVGAGLALLYAPQSGAETRKKIKETSEKVAEDIKVNYEKISDEAKKSIEQVKQTAEKAIENVKTFVDKAKDGLKQEIKAELEETTEAPKKKTAKA
jgi:gas vesicle protein